MKHHQRRGLARTAVGVITMTALAALVGACGGHSPPTGSGGPSDGGSTTSRSVVAYSACLRAHGIPRFPDPGNNGQLPKGDAQHFGVSSSQYEAAQHACQTLLPDTGVSFQQQTDQCIAASDCPPALVQQILTVQRKYARCMRSQGFPTWPDPTIDSQGRPYFDVTRAGISEAETRSSQWTSSDGECERLVGIGGDVPVDLG